MDGPALAGVVIGTFFLFVILVACCVALYCVVRAINVKRGGTRNHRAPAVRIRSAGTSRGAHLKNQTAGVVGHQKQHQTYPSSPHPGNRAPGTNPAPCYPTPPEEDGYSNPCQSAPAGDYHPQPPSYPAAPPPPYNQDYEQPTLPGQPVDMAGHPLVIQEGHCQNHQEHKRHWSGGSGGSGGS